MIEFYNNIIISRAGGELQQQQQHGGAATILQTPVADNSVQVYMSQAVQREDKQELSSSGVKDMFSQKKVEGLRCEGAGSTQINIYVHSL